MKIINSNSKELLSDLMNRSQLDNTSEQSSVDEILKKVRAEGDSALYYYTNKLDKVDLSNDGMLVSKEEIDEAYGMLDDKIKETIIQAADNIKAFHQMQKRDGFTMNLEGGYIGQRIIPMERVGVYVPGGRAAYPSTVLMNVIPAQIAGVGEIIMCTPPMSDGKVYYMTLATARIIGVDKIYKVGGAQAVGAMAFGTQSIPRVAKIVGPGNIYVALAKKSVYGYVGIDMVAGPSEVLIIADENANSKYVAADLLSQAEHDPMAAAILVTTSKKLADEVSTEVDKQIEYLKGTKENALQSIKNCSGIILVNDIEQGIKISNEIAPEHLELAVDSPEKYLDKIINAGSVFLGHYSPEPLGDYFAGPNHVLPTSSTARFSSPLGVDDFVKRSSVIYYSKEKLKSVYKDIDSFARLEGLDAHANSVSIRFSEGE
ncbi:MAG: histidinol dehydrogenase [Eubacteriales bacterium]